MGIPTSVALLFSVELKMARSVLEVVFFWSRNCGGVRIAREKIEDSNGYVAYDNVNEVDGINAD